MTVSGADAEVELLGNLAPSAAAGVPVPVCDFPKGPPPEGTIITIGTSEFPREVDAAQLWRVFCASEPAEVLHAELEYIGSTNLWDDYGFSITSLPDLSMTSAGSTLCGVDLFVIQIVVFRKRGIFPRWVSFGRLCEPDNKDVVDLGDGEKQALNDLGTHIRVAAGLEDSPKDVRFPAAIITKYLVQRLGVSQVAVQPYAVSALEKAQDPRTTATLAHALIETQFCCSRPVDVCATALADPKTAVPALAWLLRTDAVFAGLFAKGLLVVPYKLWHPDHPAAALSCAVQAVAHGHVENVVLQEPWFVGLRSFALAVHPASAVSALNLEAVHAPPPWLPFVLLDLVGSVSAASPAPARPHWVQADGSIECLAATLMEIHPKPVLWHIANKDGHREVLLGVEDDDAALAKNVPDWINGTRVRIVLSQRRGGDKPLELRSRRWDVVSPHSERINLAIEKAGAMLCASIGAVSLTAGYRRRGGAVCLDEPCVVAFVEWHNDGAKGVLHMRMLLSDSTALFCDDVPVDLEEAPPRNRRLIVRTEKEAPDYRTGSAFQMAFKTRGDPALHIGERTNKLRANGTSYEGMKGTLGCFGLNADGQVVALTAGHCIIERYHYEGANKQMHLFTKDHEAGDCFVVLRRGGTEEVALSGAWPEYDGAAKLPWMATNLHTTLPPKKTADNRVAPSAPPSALDAVDYGFLILKEGIKYNYSALGTDFDWEHAKFKPILFTGRVSEVAEGCLVFKYGATSGLTPGDLNPTRPLYEFHTEGKLLCRHKITPHKSWTSFATGGDSGSAVFDEAGDAVGIVIQEYAEFHFSVAVPIQEVLDNLNVTLLGSQQCDNLTDECCLDGSLTPALAGTAVW